MTPDEALQEIRDLIAGSKTSGRALTDIATPSVLHRDHIAVLEQLATKVHALDQHIAEGGQLPQEWQA